MHKVAFASRTPGLWRAFVDDQPVESELPCGFCELIELDRLADIAITPRAVTPQDVLLLVRGGQDDHGDELGPIVGSDTVQNLQAIDLRELEVEQDDFGEHALGVRATCEEVVERFRPITHDDDLVSEVRFG
jgi:hypothetical protein